MIFRLLGYYVIMIIMVDGMAAGSTSGLIVGAMTFLLNLKL